MKIIIFIDESTGDIWIYTPDSEGEAVFIEPKTKQGKERREGNANETKKEEKNFH